MRFRSLILRSAVLAVAAGIVLPLVSLAQTFAATTGTNPVISTAPISDVAKISVPGHHRQGDDQLMYGRVRDGVYTVDGMVAKVKLNYDMDAVKHVYMFVPGVGTAVISTVTDHDAVVTEAKLKENELTFASGDHRFKLTGVALTNDRGTVPPHLYVKLDRAAWQLGRQPMIGYGKLGQMPYEWPGAVAAPAGQKIEANEIAPPVPAVLLPSSKAVVPGTAAVVNPAALGSVAVR